MLSWHVAIVWPGLKKLLWRRQGLRRLKYEFIFYLRISRYSYVIYFVYDCQTIPKLNRGHGDKFEIEV